MGTDPAAPSGQRTDGRRLYRRTDDKVIAGVASGLGDYFRVDPVLFRIGFVALAFAGGLGLLLYGVAWLVMPTGHGSPSAGEEALRRFGRMGGDRIPVWIAVVLLVIGAGLLVDQLGLHRPDLVWGGVLITLGVLLFRHATIREDEPPAVPPEDHALERGAPPPPPGWVAPRPPAPRPPRSRLGVATIGVMLLVIGVAVLLDNSNAISISLSQYFALALLVLAGGLVIGAWVGRARWLSIPALLLIPAIVMSGLVTVPLEGGFGDRDYRPTNVFDATAHPYRLIAGRMNLDLSRVRIDRPRASVTATIVAGELHVTVPAATTLVIHARVGAGELHMFGQLFDGLKLDREETVRAGSSDLLVLDLAVSFGRIFVSRR